MDLIHDNCHGAVQHLTREAACRIVHVDRADDKQVARDEQTLLLNSRLSLFERGVKCRVCGLKQDITAKVEDVVVKISRRHNRIARPFVLTVDLPDAFARAQELGEVMFDWCKVHFVETDEKRRIRISMSLENELDEVRGHIFMLLVYSRPVTKKIGTVVPAWLDLYHLEIAGRTFVAGFQILVKARLVCQMTYHAALAGTADTSQNRQRFCQKPRNEHSHQRIFRVFQKVADGRFPCRDLLCRRLFHCLAHDFLLD